MIKITSESLTVLAAGPVAVLTPSKYAYTDGGINLKATTALVTTNTGAISFTIDGVTTPTAVVGHTLAFPNSVVLSGHDHIVNFRMKALADSEVYVSYEAEQPFTAVS